jgi:hypothetical protein
MYCRHLPVRDHLLQQLHGLTRHLLWLQLRVGLSYSPHLWEGPHWLWGPGIITWVGLGLGLGAFHLQALCFHRSSEQWESAVRGLLSYL